MSDRPPAYQSRATLAAELDVAESTVDDMVRRGILPPPVRLSTGCVRWRWADVETALGALKDAQRTAGGGGSNAGDPYLRGVSNVTKIQEGRRGSS